MPTKSLPSIAMRYSAIAILLLIPVGALPAPSIAQVDDEGLEDGQAPQGIRDSATERINVESSGRATGYVKAGKEDVDQWRQLKFGLFINWGPITLLGKPIGWSRGGEPASMWR